MVASILIIIVSQNTKCDSLIGFLKSGHICVANLPAIVDIFAMQQALIQLEVEGRVSIEP